MMMVLPISIYLLIKSSLKPVSNTDTYLLLLSENGKDLLKIKDVDFLYAKSSDNYIAINYLSNNQQKQHFIRKPLKALEMELKDHPDIKRSHRSYLVNMQNIKNIRQSKGKIQLEIGDTILPVSKKMESHFIS